MRLMIKQRVFAWTDTYDIYDEYGNPKYFVKTEFFNIGHHMHIYDMYDQEIGVIHQEIFHLLPVFEVEIGQSVGFRDGSPSLRRDMISNIMAGRCRVISSDGITTCMMAVIASHISARNCSAGAIPM